jgi:hypothetical protein
MCIVCRKIVIICILLIIRNKGSGKVSFTKQELEQLTIQLLDGVKQHVDSQVEQLRVAFCQQLEQLRLESSQNIAQQGERFDRWETSMEQLCGEVAYYGELSKDVRKTVHELTHDVYRLKKDRFYIHETAVTYNDE